MKNSVRHILWGYAFLLLTLAYIFGLFIDLTGDSGLYAAIARQMLESGDWLSLKINGDLYDQKPHLIFWLAGIGINLFGNANFAFKIFPTLWALAGIYFTYRLGKLLYSATAGKFAALIAGTSQIFVLYLFDVHTDTILQTGVIFSLWQLILYLKSDKPVHFFWGFVGVGLALLSKGPVGGVVPFFMVLIFLVSRKDSRQIFHFKWILGIVISLIVASPALIHLYKNFGVEGIRFFFITNNFGRISGEYAGSSNDLFYYLYNAIWAFMPWTVFVFIALHAEIKSWFTRDQKDIWGISLLGSVLVFVLILSIAKGKAPNYFLIVVFPFSILTGRWLAQQNSFLNKINDWILVAQWFFIGLLFLVFGIAFYMNFGNNNWFPLGLMLLIVINAFFIFWVQHNKMSRIMFISVVSVATLNLFLNASVVPNLYNYQGARQAVEIYENNRNDSDKLYNFYLEEFELFFMAKDSVYQIKDWDKLDEVMGFSGSWLYTDSIKYNDIIKMNYDIDTIYQIRQFGMNGLSFEFLNPKTREEELNNTYLIKTR